MLRKWGGAKCFRPIFVFDPTARLAKFYYVIKIRLVIIFHQFPLALFPSPHTRLGSARKRAAPTPSKLPIDKAVSLL
jgi:hypothetical protein